MARWGTFTCYFIINEADRISEVLNLYFVAFHRNFKYESQIDVGASERHRHWNTKIILSERESKTPGLAKSAIFYAAKKE